MDLNTLLPQNSEYLEDHRINAFIVKVVSICNIACTYCYMYEHADQTWREQPKKISEDTIRLLGARLEEYIADSDVKRILVVAHGGEPLLLGAAGLRNFFNSIKNATKHTSAEIEFGMQTNATLIDDEIVRVLQDFEIQAGVSLDGPQNFNDKVRIDKKGNGTFSSILRGVEKLRNPRSGKPVFGGFLTVVNPELSPKETLQFFEDLDATAVDFMLPDVNHDTYPTYFPSYPRGYFGHWLIDMFDLWFDLKSNIRIRFFHILMKLILGSKNGFDALGSSSGGVAVVETDGTYHGIDVLKTAYQGSTQTGLSVETTPIKELEKALQIIALSSKKYCLCDKCLACSIVDECGGGYLPHRYSTQNGFNQESVYCDDLQIFIAHVKKRIHVELKRVKDKISGLNEVVV